MKFFNYCTVIAVAACVSSVGFAKTDVNDKVEQLKNNAEASKDNLAQYEDGLKIVNSNLGDTDKALKQVQTNKKALLKQTADAKKGKSEADAAKLQLGAYIATETEKLNAEMKQIEQLKAALAKLDENTKKRQDNIAQYQEKIKKSDAEVTSWQEHNQEAMSLETSLNEKESQIVAEQKRLRDKKADYELEITKWKKQERVSEREYANFSKVKAD